MMIRAAVAAETYDGFLNDHQRFHIVEGPGT